MVCRLVSYVQYGSDDHHRFVPLVSCAQWQAQDREVFGATDHDLVHYVSYRDRLGRITANVTTRYTLNFIDLSRTGPLVVEVTPGPTAEGLSDSSGSASLGSSARWARTSATAC